MRSTLDNASGTEIHAFPTVMFDNEGEHEFKVNVVYEYDPGEPAERDYPGSGASVRILHVSRTDDGQKLDLAGVDHDLVEMLQTEVGSDVKSRTDRDDVDIERWDGMS